MLLLGLNGLTLSTDYEDGGYATLHHECKLIPCPWRFTMSVVEQQKRTKESMQSINRGRTGHVDTSKSKTGEQVTKETKMLFQHYLGQGHPEQEGKRRRWGRPATPFQHSRTQLGACRDLLLHYHDFYVFFWCFLFLLFFFEELIWQAPLTFIRAWYRTTPAELLAVQRYTPPSRTWELEMFR